MIITKKLLFEGSIGEAEVMSLFDSGATYSCINPEIAIKLDKPVKIRRPFKVETASKVHYIEVTDRVSLDFYIDNHHFSDEFLIIPNLSEDIIIGAKTMQSWRLKLDFEEDKVLFDPKVTQIKLI